jgi:hypothetical protein
MGVRLMNRPRAHAPRRLRSHMIRSRKRRATWGTRQAGRPRAPRRQHHVLPQIRTSPGQATTRLRRWRQCPPRRSCCRSGGGTWHPTSGAPPRLCLMALCEGTAACSVGYRGSPSGPLQIVRGEKQCVAKAYPLCPAAVNGRARVRGHHRRYLIDESGRKFLDCVNNVVRTRAPAAAVAPCRSGRASATWATATSAWSEPSRTRRHNSTPTRGTFTRCACVCDAQR